MHSDQPYCDLVTSYWPGDIHQQSQWQTMAATCDVKLPTPPGCNGSQNYTISRTGSLAVMGHIINVIWRKSNYNDLESWELGLRCIVRYKSVTEWFFKTIINTEKRENSLSSVEVYNFTHFPFFSLFHHYIYAQWTTFGTRDMIAQSTSRYLTLKPPIMGIVIFLDF